MTQTDRFYGLNGSLGVKAPCRVATTANITLSGLQTIDGIALAAGDRVLVKNQTSGVDNGIYDVSTGAWVRSPDFDGAYDVVTGSMSSIQEGTANSSRTFRVSTTGDITVGTTSLAFVDAVFGAAATAAQAAQAGAEAAQAAASASAVLASTVAATSDASSFNNFGHVPVKDSVVTFHVVGDHTSVYHTGRRFVLNDNGTLRYGRVTAASYSGGNTNITYTGGFSLTGPLISLAVGSAVTGDPIASDSIDLYVGSSPAVEGFYIPASAFTPNITNGPSVGLVEIGTNKVMAKTLDFDAAAVESAQVQFVLPSDWDAGDIYGYAVVSVASGSANSAVFAISALASVSGEAIDTAFGTAVDSVVGNLSTSNYIYESTIQSATPSGTRTPGTSLITLRISRNVAHASDTFATDVRLHGFWLKYRKSSVFAV